MQWSFKRKILFSIVFLLMLDISFYSKDIKDKDKEKDKEKKDKTEKLIEKELKKETKDLLKIEKKSEKSKYKEERIFLKEDFFIKNGLEKRAIVNNNINEIEIIMNKLEKIQVLIKGESLVKNNLLEGIVSSLITSQNSFKKFVDSLEKEEKIILNKELKDLETHFNSINKNVDEIKRINKKQEAYEMIINLKKKLKEVYRIYRAIEWIISEG